MEAKIEELKKDQQHYRSGIAELDQEAQQLENDPEAMERYAREHYFMRKAGEDVYVIVEE
jgi:cell division protein FtsB